MRNVTVLLRGHPQSECNGFALLPNYLAKALHRGSVVPPSLTPTTPRFRGCRYSLSKIVTSRRETRRGSASVATDVEMQEPVVNGRMGAVTDAVTNGVTDGIAHFIVSVPCRLGRSTMWSGSRRKRVCVARYPQNRLRGRWEAV